MNLNATLLRVFNIQVHERDRVVLLILKSFFLGIYISYFFSFANGIFLSKFDIKYLPLAYVLSGILGFLFSTIFVAIQKKVKFYSLLVGAMLFDLLLTLLFVGGFRILDDTTWLIFIVFISVGPIFSLINVSFWSLTSSIFDLREGKRLFGIIGTGGVISSILSYFSIPLVIGLVGDSSNLMVIGIFGLILSIVIQLTIMKRLPEAKAAQNVSTKKSKEPGLSLKEIFTNKYFRLVFLLVIFSMMSQYFVDYNFMGIARMQMQDEIQLTSFFGVFYGLAKVVELLFRTLAAGRLMSKYGMIVGLLLLPILLLSFTSIALGGYFITSGLGFLFLLFAMIKLIDNVVRRSMDEPAVKTLYQPVDSKTKQLLQTSIEGKGKQLAVMLAGIVLMLFNLSPNFSIAIAATMTCLLIVTWIVYAYKTYNEYRVLLNNQLTAPSDFEGHDHRANNAFYFSRGIDSDNQVTFVKSTLAIHDMKPDVLIPLYPKLVQHSDYNVRIQTTNWIKELPLLSLSVPLNDQIRLESDPENLNSLKEINQIIKSILETSKDEVKGLLLSDIKADRIKAAAWICHFEEEDFISHLEVLLRDKNAHVVRATSFYISSIENPVFLKALIACFVGHKSYEHSILKTLMLNSNKAKALLNISFDEFKEEERFVLIEEAFRASLKDPLMLINIINTLGKLENKYSKEYLKRKLNTGNWATQYFILENLKYLGHFAAEIDLATYRQLILKETSFCAWILASKYDLKKGEFFPDLMKSLNEQLEGSKKKIFNILSFLYPREAIANIENNIMSGIPEKEVMALEMADILLDEVHKDIIFPLFDKISVADKVKNLSQHFPQATMSQEERLKNIIFYDYAMLNNVTKAFAVEALESKSNNIPYEITAQIYGNDLLLKEIAYSEIYNRNETLFNKYIGRESEKTKLQLIKTLTSPEGNNTILSRLSVVHLLNDQPLFSHLPFWQLSLITSFFKPFILKANEPSYNVGVSQNKVHIFINGAVQSISNGGKKVMLKSGDLFGFYDVSIFKRKLNVIEDSLLFSISKPDFHSILEGLPEVCEVLYNLYIADEFTKEEEIDVVDDLYLEYS